MSDANDLPWGFLREVQVIIPARSMVSYGEGGYISSLVSIALAFHNLGPQPELALATLIVDAERFTLALSRLVPNS